jgi:hypothetical protein
MVAATPGAGGGGRRIRLRVAGDVGQHAGVGVGGQHDAGLPKHDLDRLKVGAGGEREGGRRGAAARGSGSAASRAAAAAVSGVCERWLGLKGRLSGWAKMNPSGRSTPAARRCLGRCPVRTATVLRSNTKVRHWPRSWAVAAPAGGGAPAGCGRWSRWRRRGPGRASTARAPRLGAARAARPGRVAGAARRTRSGQQPAGVCGGPDRNRRAWATCLSRRRRALVSTAPLWVGCVGTSTQRAGLSVRSRLRIAAFRAAS